MGVEYSYHAAREGDLRYLSRQHLSESDKIVVSLIACSWAHFHILQWLHCSGHQFNEMTHGAAVVSGKKNVVKWLIERGVPFSERVTFHICADNPKYADEWCKEHAINPNIYTYFSVLCNPFRFNEASFEAFLELIEAGCPININQCFSVSDQNGIRDTLTILKSKELWNDFSEDFSLYLQWPPEEVMEDIYKLMI